MIEVQNLTKRYGSHAAVRGLSFRVPSGQICGFLGPNGAGKSTTLRMLTGFVAPTRGSIRIGGIDALAEPIAARRHIGYMPEACPLYPEMRVGEYLRYRAELKGVPRARIKARVEASLEQATVTDVEHRIIGQLSKGYRQRVGLADALVADPPLLVLDEPTAGLDPNQIRQVRDLITQLAKNKTVLLSTHILPEVEAICDRVLIIHKGTMVSEGDPAAMRTELAGRRLIRLEGRGRVEAFERCLGEVARARVVEVRGARDNATGRAAEQGEAAGLVRARLEAEDDRVAEDVFRAVAAAGLVLRELRLQQASLEDVFADLTTAEEAAEVEGESGAGPASDEDEAGDEDEAVGEDETGDEGEAGDEGEDERPDGEQDDVDEDVDEERGER